MTRGWRALAALLLGVAMGLGFISPAYAAPGGVAQPGDIDASRLGSVTIRLDDTDGPVPAAGSAGFELWLVNGIDLTTAEGWADAIYLAEDPAGITADQLAATPLTAVSDAAGHVIFADVPVGLYLLRQTSGPDLMPIMLVPVPTQDLVNEGEWLYDVELFAKAEPVPVDKLVSDGNAGVDGEDAAVAGQVLTYTFETGIPRDGLRGFGGACLRDGIVDAGTGLDPAGFNAEGRCADGASWSGTADGAGYRLVDDLAAVTVPGAVESTADYLAWNSGSFTGQVTAQVRGATSVALTACPDATATDCDYVVDQTANKLQIDLTDRGMTALADARTATAEARLVVTAQAIVLDTVTEITQQSATDLDGQLPFVLRLPNKVIVFPSGPAIEYGLPVESPTTQTIYTTLKLHKVTADQTDLSGATFTLYRTLADAQAETNPLATSLPTDENGMTQFAGLHVTDFQNNADDDDSYWVVESGVPAGYVGLSGAFEVKLTRDGLTINADETGGYPVLNTRGPGPGPSTPPSEPGEPGKPTPPRPGFLPQTGVGWALSGLAVVGVGAVATAGLSRLISRRRSDDTEAEPKS